MEYQQPTLLGCKFIPSFSKLGSVTCNYSDFVVCVALFGFFSIKNDLVIFFIVLFTLRPILSPVVIYLFIFPCFVKTTSLSWFICDFRQSEQSYDHLCVVWNIFAPCF